MSLGALTDTVIGHGETPIVDPERTGLAVNINNEALTSLPVSTQRRYQDIWALVPGVYVRPDQSDINPSVNSRGTSENSTRLDGMDVTDPFGGGVFSVGFNYDAIQDVQIKTLGAEAEDGGRTGGFMSIMTKSGSNQLHGSAAFFVIPDAFNSSNVEGVAANQRTDIQPDFTLGGPIARRQGLVLRRLSPHLRGPDAQQRAGAARAARQPDLREDHVADQRGAIACRARSSTTRRGRRTRSSATR